MGEAGSAWVQWGKWLAILLLGAVILRVVALASGDALQFGDTSGYEELGRAIASFDLSADMGHRTPVYPVLLAILGFDWEMVRIAQLTMGLGVSVLLFSTAFRLTDSGPLALLSGAVYGWNPTQATFETAISTESLTVLLLVSAVAMLARIVDVPSRVTTLAVGLTGLLAALGALTRPIFLLLPIAILGTALLARLGWHTVITLSIAGILPVLAWSGFNAHRLDYFGPTTLTGLGLTNHTGAYIEDAPDEYATVRDIYLAERTRRGGVHEMVIWSVWEEMTLATHQTHAQLSRTLARMSISLIVSHPGEYSASVAKGFCRFWLGANWKYDQDISSATDRVMFSVTKIARGLLILIQLGALGLASVVIFRARHTYRGQGGWHSMLALGVFVMLAGALGASAMESGELSRYGVPFSSLAGLVLALAVYGNRILGREAE